MVASMSSVALNRIQPSDTSYMSIRRTRSTYPNSRPAHLPSGDSSTVFTDTLLEDATRSCTPLSDLAFRRKILYAMTSADPNQHCDAWTLKHQWTSNLPALKRRLGGYAGEITRQEFHSRCPERASASAAPEGVSLATHSRALQVAVSLLAPPAWLHHET
jgi:hypothetical protein